MNKTVSLMILSLMIIGMIGVVSATYEFDGVTTIIAGKIYTANYNNVIANASVTVNCSGYILTDTSKADGAYRVEYNGASGDCGLGDTLTVSAVKDDLTGSKTGKIKATGDCTNADNCLISVTDNFDVAVVNVPLVPEFGLIAGLTTVLGALGVFFFVRKK